MGQPPGWLSSRFNDVRLVREGPGWTGTRCASDRTTQHIILHEVKLLTEPLSADLLEPAIGITDECLLLSESLSDSVLPNTEIQSVAESQSDKSQSDRDRVSCDRVAVSPSRELSRVHASGCMSL